MFERCGARVAARERSRQGRSGRKIKKWSLFGLRLPMQELKPDAWQGGGSMERFITLHSTTECSLLAFLCLYKYIFYV
jgi:hypothetical protein